MARRSPDLGEEFFRLIIGLGAILILAVGGGAALKKVLSSLTLLLLLAFGLFLLWLVWRGLRTPTRTRTPTRGEVLAEYLRSRPYERPAPDPGRQTAGPPPPNWNESATGSPPEPQPEPRREPGPTIRVEDPPRPRDATPDVDGIVAHLRSLDWFQFENAMGVLFGHTGYRVRRTGGANPDGGIDLELAQGTSRIAVQCKHWRAGEVGVRVVREFMGAMLAAGIPQGILIASGGFTAPARDLARQHGIELHEERDIARRVLNAGGWSDPLFRAAFVSPPKLCPKCGSPLVERVARRGAGAGQPFYGCSRYPRCKQTMPR